MGCDMTFLFPHLEEQIKNQKPSPCYSLLPLDPQEKCFCDWSHKPGSWFLPAGGTLVSSMHFQFWTCVKSLSDQCLINRPGCTHSRDGTFCTWWGNCCYK